MQQGGLKGHVYSGVASRVLYPAEPSKDLVFSGAVLRVMYL